MAWRVSPPNVPASAARLPRWERRIASLWRYGSFSLVWPPWRPLDECLGVATIDLHRILCDQKFVGKVKTATLMATHNSYKALYYKKSLVENRNWMESDQLYNSLL